MNGQPVPTWNNTNFLYWDPGQQGSPPGELSLTSLSATAAILVSGANQNGCGFESSLEAWYRFLVDPAPYDRIVPVDCESQQPDPAGECRAPEGVDSILLAQRVPTSCVPTRLS